MKALISVSPLKTSPIERVARAAFTALTVGRDRDPTDACQRLLIKAAVQRRRLATGQLR